MVVEFEPVGVLDDDGACFFYINLKTMRIMQYCQNDTFSLVSFMVII